MSARSLKSLRDSMHRENADLYDALSANFKEAIDVFAGKTVKQVLVQTDVDGTPGSRSAIAEAECDALHDILHKESSTISEVHERFVKSLGSIIKCDITEVSSANVSRLSEADCRRALPLACKMLYQMTKMAGIQAVISQAFEKRMECQRKQALRWDAEACKHAQEVDRLRAHADATEKRLRELTTSVSTCAKHLATLAPSPKKAKNETSLSESEALQAAINNAEKTIKAAQETTKLLERKLADVAEQLEVMRAAYDDVSGRVQNSEAHLKVALEKGTSLAAKCEELDEKLRCSTCMDRQKNVAFACGHAYCDQCAADWDTCTVNCKRQNSEKPVRFRYPLFL